MPSIPGIFTSRMTRSGVSPFGERETFLAGRGAHKLVPFVLERHPQRIADRRFIVDDEDA